MCKTTILECRYCDGTMSRYSKEYEATICVTCGAEWEPVEVEVELPEFDESPYTHDCLECDKQYDIDTSLASDDHLFCSPSCETEYHKTECSCCGKKYDDRESSANEHYEYCSMECEIAMEETAASW